MHENKTFLLDFFCNILEKTRYFNIRFVSLHYKNTNQYQLKLVEILRENHKFFKGFFWNCFGIFCCFLFLFLYVIKNIIYYYKYTIPSLG